MNFKEVIQNNLTGQAVDVHHCDGYYQLSLKSDSSNTLIEVNENYLTFDNSLSNKIFYIPIDKINKVTLSNPKIKNPKPSFEEYKESVLTGLRVQRAWSYPTDEQLRETYNNLK